MLGDWELGFGVADEGLRPSHKNMGIGVCSKCTKRLIS